MMKSEPANNPLSGLNILISGGTTGIGRATALALAREGANVFVFGREEAPLNDILKLGKDLRGKITGVCADQSDPAEVEKVFAQFSKEFPQLDALINNAAIGGQDLQQDTDEGILYTVRSNFCGYLFCARRALKLMKKRRAGCIINIGSINAEEMDEGGEIYTGTKAAIRAFSESLRKTVQKAGIKICLIEPGSTGTDMSDESPEEQRKAEAARKMLKAEDIADAVVYCLSRPRQTVVASIQVLPLLDQEE